MNGGYDCVTPTGPVRFGFRFAHAGAPSGVRHDASPSRARSATFPAPVANLFPDTLFPRFPYSS